MPYRQHTSPRYKPIHPKVKPKKGVYYCPKCVDEQKSCPYYFKPGKCPEHPRTKLIFDPELTRMLLKEKGKV